MDAVPNAVERVVPCAPVASHLTDFRAHRRQPAECRQRRAQQEFGDRRGQIQLRCCRGIDPVRSDDERGVAARPETASRNDMDLARIADPQQGRHDIERSQAAADDKHSLRAGCLAAPVFLQGIRDDPPMRRMF